MADLDGYSLRRTARRGDAEKLGAALLTLAAHRAELVAHREQPWASVTFSGTRHQVTLSFNGADAIAAGEDFIARLPDHEFTIANRLVADADVTEVEHRIHPNPRLLLRCEILMLEEV